MRTILNWAALLTALLVLAGCAGKEPSESKWEEPLYRTVVYNSGEDESDAAYLEIAQCSQKLLAVLEEKAGAFVMDAYNYQTIDDEGTPLYTMNKGILFSNTGSVYGFMSSAPPQRAEPYSVPRRYFFAFLPLV